MPALTKEQLEQRATGIGSSEIASALGLDDSKTAYQLWLAKRGEAQDEPDEEQAQRMQAGHDFEPYVAKTYERRNDAVLAPNYETFQHPDIPWMRATPDFKRIVPTTPRTIVETKFWDSFAIGQFGEEGTDQVPMKLFTQALGQLAVCHVELQVERVDIAVHFGPRYGGWTVNYDQQPVDRLIERLADFWRHVETGTPPKPQSLADVRRMFARDVGRIVEATQPVAEAVEKLRKVKAAMKQYEEVAEWCELTIQSHMKDASTLIMPDGQIAATWKSAKDSRRMDLDILKAEYPDVYERCLVTKAGSRRFLLK